MAFRYLIYRTDFGNTIVRESPTNTSTGGTEVSLYTDFIIPEIQPLYLWRVSGGVSVIPNTDVNISNWLNATAPLPQADDPASVGYVTGLTENKIDIVTGVSNEVPVFNSSGNLDSSGYTIDQLTGGTGGGVTEETFTGYTATTETRLQDIEGDISSLSGETDNKIDKVLGATGNLSQFTLDGNIEDSGYSISDITGSFSGVSYTEFNAYTAVTDSRLDTVESDVSYISGVTDTKLDSSEFINYSSVTDSRLDTIESNISYISGVTDTKLNISLFNSYTGTTETRLGGIESDISDLTTNKLEVTLFNSYTGTTETRLSGIESDISELSGATGQAITGATNGLTKVGQSVRLGGILTQDVVISGITHDFTLNVQDITLQSTGSINLIDTAGSGVNLESDGGSIDIVGNTSLGVETTKLTISETSLVLTDNRGSATGLQYAADYSTDFVSRSLVDKGYVDSVASGLIPKASVDVATTSNIDLTGGTFGGTIDGVSISNGWRVLVKDQTDPIENGIYDYVSGSNTFTRSADFDGTPVGEISDGNLVPIVSGATLYNTIWVLVTPNPITVDVTPLEFTLFSVPHELISGLGINISGNTISVDGPSLAGNSIVWSGNTFNVDIDSGTLANALDDKLNVIDFNSYSATTDTRLDNVESDISSLSGDTANKLDSSIFNTYTGNTETRLTDIENDITAISGDTANKLDTEIFTGFTASTAPNEIFLIHTGGTEINTVAATAIDWDSVQISGTSYLWTGGSTIFIQEAGDYELNYNLPFNTDTNRNIAIGGNIVKNNNTILDVTSTGGGGNTNSGGAGSLGLPTVIVTLAQNDRLDLVAFRTEQSGSVLSSANGSILIKKKNTPQ